MGHPTQVRCDSADESFVRWLRQALRHLYDPTRLHGNPLFGYLGLDEEAGPSALRSVLVDAIEALKPESSVSPQSQAWRTYRTLLHRYVDQFSQTEVSANFCLSVRQLRRQESLALRALADHLWSRHKLCAGDSDQGTAAAEGGAAATASREQELAWLERSLPSEPVDLAQMVQAALKTVGPLMAASDVRAECRLPGKSPRLAVQRTTMQQALVNILTAAIRSAQGGRVGIEVKAGVQQVDVSVRPVRPAPAGLPLLSANYAEGLKMAQELLALSGGSLEVSPGGSAEIPFTARLVLPTPEQLAVLVIDDNADTLQLFQRHLAGSRYLFIGTRDPEQALALAERLAPQIIVLDVMLPGIDGWELLGRLRVHPRMRGTPVIVCTILPEEQLALTLGATAFLRKPFTRTELFAALDRRASLPEREFG